MLLMVGPSPAIHHRAEEVKGAWDELILAVPDLPFVPNSVKHWPYHGNPPGVAWTSPKIGPAYPTTEHVWLVLNEPFLALSAEERTLTLLHELTHARFLTGPMRDRFLESQAFGAENALTGDEQGDEFSFQRLHLASLLNSQLDEVVAELHLQRAYPDLGAGRSAQLLRMQRQRFADGEHLKAHPDLREYRTLLELLRCKTGEVASEGRSEEQAEWRRLYEATADAALEATGAERLAHATRNLDRLMAVRLEPLEFFHDAYRDLMREVMALERTATK